jgi:hypothetical protein
MPSNKRLKPLFSAKEANRISTWRRGLRDGRVGRIPIEKQIQPAAP